MAGNTSTKRKGTSAKADKVWTDEERAAMQESARERRSASRSGKLSEAEQRAQGEQEIRDKIAELPDADRAMATRVHELVTATAPGLMPRTYYGMPAYAKDGKVICFFQPASKFKVRYSTFGFQPDASLDDGTIWPTSWAVTELTPAAERQIAALVKRAAG